MNKILTFLSLLLFCFGCNNKSNCQLDSKILKFNDSIILKAKSEKTLLPILDKIKEPELESFGDETYRFMIVGSFGEYQTYRINKKTDGYVMTSRSYFSYHEIQDKEIDSLGQEKKTIISKSDWVEIKNSIDALNFWSLQAKIKDNYYLDGAAYLIEGYNPKKNECTNRNYHITVRICPRDSTLYKTIFEKVRALTSK